jgi:Ran GTPase-activating protein (RanGAP) involved in mRNA processing and transport
MLGSFNTKKQKIARLHVSSKQQEEAVETVHKLLNTKLPALLTYTPPFDMAKKDTQITTFSTILDSKSLDAPSVFDLTNTNQVLLQAIRQYKEQRQKSSSISIVAPSQPQTLIIPKTKQAIAPCSCGCHRMRQDAPEELKDIFLQQARLDENTAAMTQTAHEAEDEDMDQTVIQMLAANQRRAIPFLPEDHMRNNCSAALLTNESFHPNTNRKATCKFLIRSLYGYFSRDRSRTSLLIFSSLNLSVNSFPQKILALFMQHEDRKKVMEHVETEDVSIPKIDLALGLVYRQHVHMMIDLVSTISSPLAHLNLSGLQIQDAHIRTLRERSLRVRHIDLSANRITDEGIKHVIGLALLEGVSLVQNDINDSGVRDLFKHSKLRVVQLGHNNITDMAFKDITFSKNLRVLDLSNNMINEEGMYLIAACKTLRHLSLRYVCLTNEGLKQYFIHTEAKLRYLDVSYNSIDAEGAKTIATYGTDLEELDIGYNNISNEGAAALMSSSTCSKLSKVNMTNNQIYSDGIMEIENNQTLHWVNLSRNCICDRSMMAFASNTALQHLNLSYNNLTNAGVQLLQEYANVQYLEVEGNLQ